MLFNSLHFLIFFPIIVAAYYAIPHRFRWFLLLLASYYFYMSWKPAYLILIVFSTIIDFYAGRLLSRTKENSKRRLLLGASLATNLGMLFVFKYFNFFNDSIEGLCHALGINYAVPALNVLLPVGISFYTFQTLSYTIDVYAKKIPHEPHLGRFALFVSFFPQLVAGPIERASRLIPQLRTPVAFDNQRFLSGLKLITWGMFKKVVIADRLALFVDPVYNNPGAHEGITILLATYFFAFQIYADFSAYSDIAIGSARILGIDLMENFRRPYFAHSISDFWKRWHISLSTWFRDYVYIPLGGNRCTKRRWLLNLLIVFLVSGLWHGANWTFLLWGALHGSYLIAEVLRPSTDPRDKKHSAKRFPLLPIFVSFHLVLLSWVFFRANSISDAFLILRQFAHGLPAHLANLLSLDIRFFYEVLVVRVGVSKTDLVLSFLFIFFFVCIDLAREFTVFSGTTSKLFSALRYAYYDALVIAILLFGVFGQQQFLYFQF